MLDLMISRPVEWTLMIAGTLLLSGCAIFLGRRRRRKRKILKTHALDRLRRVGA